MTRLEEIEARLKAATEGPWTVGSEPALNMVADCGEAKDGQPQYVFGYRLAPAKNDTDFIAHARQDIPYLLAQLKEARGKLEAVEAALQEHGYSHAREFLGVIFEIMHPEEGE